MGVDLFTEARDGKTRESFNRYESGFMNPSLKVLYEFWENHYKAISTANIAKVKWEKAQNYLSLKEIKVWENYISCVLIFILIWCNILVKYLWKQKVILK